MSIRVIKWSEELSVGIRAFDRDHRNLVEILNEIAHAIDAGASPVGIAQLVNHLADETESHFRREEGFLMGAGYPDAERHRQEHGRLLGEIRAIAVRLAAGEAVEDGELYEFLRGWLVDHVVTFDKEYVPWARRSP